MNASSATFSDRVARDLEAAVERGEIVAHYQPQIDTASGRVVAVEALCRWLHPELGQIRPEVFIPIAEETGSIHEIGRYMIEDGCTLAAEWEGAGRPVEVAVNVSALQLAPDFFDHLRQSIDDRIEPAHLTVEITESRVIADVPAVARQLSRIRDLGVGISIDDFGTGHSTVDQLIGLPATELKIDRSIVQEESAMADRMLEALIGLVHQRGLRVVAEGVETARQLDRVRHFRCDRAQGYFIAQPMPREELARFISSRSDMGD
ncbi:MAG: EAL domain-containing protein [Leifsonia sp.]